MQQINEYPVLSQLIAVTPINIDDPHLGRRIGGGEPQETVTLIHFQVWPAKPAAVISFGVFKHVAVELDVLQSGIEGSLVLLLFSGDLQMWCQRGLLSPERLC